MQLSYLVFEKTSPPGWRSLVTMTKGVVLLLSLLSC